MSADAPTAGSLSAAAFLGLQSGADPFHMRLPVTMGICSGLGALFGGCGLAAGIEAIEEATGRPVAWATAQYLAFAPPPEVLDVDVTEAVRGRSTSQARAVLRLRGEEILTVNAALGARSAPFDGRFVVAPQVPEPDECPPRPELPMHKGTVAGRIETRLANARTYTELPGPPAADGASAYWMRIADIDTSTATPASELAILGDYLPLGVLQALGTFVGSSSLDNTVRIVHRHPSDWILVDVRVHAVANGYAHGDVFLWNEARELMAVASQTCLVREPPTEIPDPTRPPSENR